MSRWGSASSRRLLKALLKKGWQLKRQTGSHRVLSKEGFSDYVLFMRRRRLGRVCWHASRSTQVSRLKISKLKVPANDWSGRGLSFR